MNDERADPGADLRQGLDRHRGLLFKIVRAYSRRTPDGEDLFQEIAIQLWQSIPSYGGRCAETTWIYRVAFYVAMRWSTGERKRRESHAATLDEDSPVAATPARASGSSASRCSIQVKTVSCVSRSIKRRVREIVE